MQDKPLTAKQQLFVQEYLIDLNATAAYQRVYPKSNPKSSVANAARLIANDNIRQAIEEGKKKRMEKVEVSADEILRELKRIAFVDPRSLMEWGPNGVILKDSNSLPEDVARCVSEASQTTTKEGGSIRIKMSNKLDALEKLGKHIGLFPDKLNINSLAKIVLTEEIVDGNNGNDPQNNQASPETG